MGVSGRVDKPHFLSFSGLTMKITFGRGINSRAEKLTADERRARVRGLVEQYGVDALARLGIKGDDLAEARSHWRNLRVAARKVGKPMPTPDAAAVERLFAPATKTPPKKRTRQGAAQKPAAKPVTKPKPSKHRQTVKAPSVTSGRSTVLIRRASGVTETMEFSSHLGAIGYGGELEKKRVAREATQCVH